MGLIFLVVPSKRLRGHGVACVSGGSSPRPNNADSGLVGELFTKYGNLLTAASWHDLTPTLQHNWEAVFQIPWIEGD
jgi:hypothetical protein